MTDTTRETARLVADVALFGQREGDLYVLAILRGHAPYQNCWALPGGHVDVGEETLDAAYRELAEETGLRVVALRLVGVYADPDRDPRGRYVDFAYTTWLPTTPPPTAGDDATEAQWVLVDELLSISDALAFDHARIIRDALRVVTGGRAKTAGGTSWN